MNKDALRVLVVTNLFPNSRAPGIASFNRQQFAALGALCDVEVLATQPWFPGQRLLARYATHKVALNVPSVERIDGLSVRHPKTLHIPKIGSAVAVPLFTASLLPLMGRYRNNVDVVLGSWAHPDGCAAILLAKYLGVPCAVKVHGSDLNVQATMPGPKRALQLLLPKADALISVSTALADKAVELGVAKERIHLVMNGVDGERFRVRDRAQARRDLGLPEEGRIALCVGNVIASKGVFELQQAFARIAEGCPDLHLYFVGNGHGTEALAAEQVTRMHLMGRQDFSLIPTWMAACDVLVLPSWNEGTPNVILEALACGRRVIATRVGGVPDVLFDEALGVMVPPKDVDALAAALQTHYGLAYDPSIVAGLGARGDWDDSATSLYDVLRSL